MKRYYGLTEPYERKPRAPRRRPPKPAPRSIALFGSHHIIEVRDERGRKALRYSKEVA